MAREIICRKYTLTGRVQGVGLRYKAHIIAESLGLTGYVKNSYDGSVILVLEGTLDQMSEMLVMLGRQSYIEIEGVEYEPMQVQGFRYFEVKSSL